MTRDLSTPRHDWTLEEVEALFARPFMELVFDAAAVRWGRLDFVLHAVAYAVRDHLVERWMKTTRASYAQDVKRVYYLSMEFLIGRLLEDATINLGLRDVAAEVMAGFGQDFRMFGIKIHRCRVHSRTSSEKENSQSSMKSKSPVRRVHWRSSQVARVMVAVRSSITTSP